MNTKDIHRTKLLIKNNIQTVVSEQLRYQISDPTKYTAHDLIWSSIWHTIRNVRDLWSEIFIALDNEKWQISHQVEDHELLL